MFYDDEVTGGSDAETVQTDEVVATDGGEATEENAGGEAGSETPATEGEGM